MEQLTMNQMSQTPKLSEALAKTIGSMKSAEKSGKNSFFKDAQGRASEFSTLDDCYSVIVKPLSDNGLTFRFDIKTEFIEKEPANFIRYILEHSSGEKIESSWVIMYLAKRDAQGFGAACTYYKRQMLKSVFPIGDIDDDGNSISEGVKTPPNSAPQVRPPNMAPNAARNSR